MTAKEMEDVLDITLKQLIALKGQFKSSGNEEEGEAAVKVEADHTLDFCIRKFKMLKEAAPRIMPSPINAKY